MSRLNIGIGVQILILSAVTGTALTPIPLSSNPRKRTSWLPTCQRLLANMSVPMMDSVRDTVQEMGYHRRKVQDFQMLEDRKVKKPDDPAEAAAYSTDLTEAELRSFRTHHQDLHDVLFANLTATLQQLRDERVLDHDSPNIFVQACVSGRTNTELYHGRPKVSVLLQYANQPELIQPLLDALAACQAAVSLELVVNVDEPSARQAWVNATYSADSGHVLVVPIFSVDVHEIRGYNRAARVARGDVVVIVKDVPPVANNCSWLQDIVRVFDHWRDVGLVGLHDHAQCGKDDGAKPSVAFQDPHTGVPMQFVQHVSVPMAIRRNAFLDVGGLDESFGVAAGCGPKSQWDRDVGLRMWIAGWQVLGTHLLHQPLAPSAGVAGGADDSSRASASLSAEAASRCLAIDQAALASKVLQYKIDDSLQDDMCRVAHSLNTGILQKREGGSGPTHH